MRTRSPKIPLESSLIFPPHTQRIRWRLDPILDIPVSVVIRADQDAEPGVVQLVTPEDFPEVYCLFFDELENGFGIVFLLGGGRDNDRLLLAVFLADLLK